MNRISLVVQHWLARFLVPVTFGLIVPIMRWALRYRWENFHELRKQFLSIAARSGRPLVICPNHLTMIDSMVLTWALCPWWAAVAHPRLFAWNTPEKKNFAHVAPARVLCYMGKCIPVIRKGRVNQTRAFMRKIQGLLSIGQSLMMFPEGKRSESGRVDTENFSYGLGKIVSDARRNGINPQILLVYLRGDRQKQKSFVPPRHSLFRGQLEAFAAETNATGMRAARDISTQIVNRLAEMEAMWFLDAPTR